MNRLPTFILVLVLFSSCGSEFSSSREELHALRSKLDSLSALKAVESNISEGKIATFLTFQENNAEEAMNFYVGLFEHSRITDIQRWGKDGPGAEGTIFFATFELNGSKFACSDSYIKHDWTFTPGVSNWVVCESEAEIKRLFSKLSQGGTVLMPLDNYGWSSKFAFVEDRFGISWQLNLD